MSLKIERATLDHAQDVGYVHSLSWQKAYEGIVPEEYLYHFTPEKRTIFFREVMMADPDEYYIAYLDHNPIGMISLGKSLDSDADDETGQIMCIYLLSEYWGQGYGKKLMNFCIDRLKELSFQHIVLWVLEENRRARAFYENYGFGFDGTTKEFRIGIPLKGMRYGLGLSGWNQTEAPQQGL